MQKFTLYLMLAFLSFSAHAELEVITLQHRSAEDVLPVVRPLLGKDGAASGMNNRLILRDSPRNIAEIKRLLANIDSPPRRLRITVMQDVDGETARRLIEMSGSVGLGRDARLSVPGSAGEGGLAVEAGQGEDRVRARVISTRSLEDDRKTQQVQVVEGGRALINVGQSVPVQQRQVVQSPWSTQVIESTQYRDVNSGFYVRPLLSGVQVTLEVSAQNDALAPGRDDPAAMRVQQVNTTVSGRLGEWMELGGAVRQAESSESGLSTRSASEAHERRHVLLKVEEIE